MRRVRWWGYLKVVGLGLEECVADATLSVGGEDALDLFGRAQWLLALLSDLFGQLAVGLLALGVELPSPQRQVRVGRVVIHHLRLATCQSRACGVCAVRVVCACACAGTW